MPDDSESSGSGILDLAPRNRREFAALVVGVALSLGMSQIPGLTVEPKELSECRVSLATATAEVVAAVDAREVAANECIKAKGSLDLRIERCWERARELRAGSD